MQDKSLLKFRGIIVACFCEFVTIARVVGYGRNKMWDMVEKDDMI